MKGGLQYFRRNLRLQRKMTAAARLNQLARDQNEGIADVVRRERSRLLNFIRRRVPDPADAEDVLQDVFYRLVEANRLLMPIDHVTSWLFRVARNRIIDLVRKRTPEIPADLTGLEDLVPSSEDGPDSAYAQQAFFDELAAALDELPAEQRAVFVAHVIEGRSFKEIERESGVNMNTLLARKRYAVQRLRERLTVRRPGL
jgi:RNA polymerase sigma factor (sigma-70 family)